MKLGIFAAALIGAAALVPVSSAMADEGGMEVARVMQDESGGALNQVAPPDANEASALQSVRPAAGMLPLTGQARSFVGAASFEQAVGGDLRTNRD